MTHNLQGNQINNMKRKLFSQKDGTTFREDIKDIPEDVKNFFHSSTAIVTGKQIGRAHV